MVNVTFDSMTHSSSLIYNQYSARSDGNNSQGIFHLMFDFINVFYKQYDTYSSQSEGSVLRHVLFFLFKIMSGETYL